MTSIYPFAFFRVVASISTSLVFVGLSIQAQTYAVNTFSVPGSTATQPSAITARGIVVGSYNDPIASKTRGFIRHLDGSFTSVDVPGDTIPGGTVISAVNTAGDVAGNAHIGEGVVDFVRTAGGNLKTYQVAANSNIVGLDSSDDTTGYIDFTTETAGRDVIDEGFFRYFNGETAPIKYPGLQDTIITGSNAAGTAVGVSSTSELALFGNSFFRSANGVYTTFYFPGYPHETIPNAINDSGVIAGSLADTLGFLRFPDGSFKSFELSGLSDIQVIGINAQGDVAGVGHAASGEEVFVRLASGDLSGFVIPNATAIHPVGIDDQRRIAGTFDTSSGSYAFIAVPSNP